MGKSKKSVYRAWEDKELALLDELVSNGKSYREISKFLGRSYASVATRVNHRKREGLLNTQKFPGFDNNNSRWTEEEDLKLVDMIVSGATTAEIALALGRSRAAIWARKSNHKFNEVRLKGSRGTDVPVSLGTRRKPQRDPNQESLDFETAEPAKEVEVMENSDTSAIEKIMNLAKESGLKVTIMIS